MQPGGGGRRPTWAPTAAFAVTTTVGYGILYYAYGVLLVPMHEDLGWSRTFLSAALSLSLLVGAVMAIPVGRWLDRHRPRPVFVVGSALSALLVLAWGTAQDRTTFLAIWMLLGLGQAVLFYEAAFTVLTKRFDGRARHNALTVVTLAGGLASSIFGPLTASLDHQLGWRGAVTVLGAIVAVTALPCAWFGLHPGAFARSDDEPGGAAGPTDGDPPGESAEPSTTPADALRSRAFRLLTMAYLLATATTIAVAVHVVGYLTDRGMAGGTAAVALGSIGIAQVLGRLVFGRVGRHDATSLATWVLGARAVGLVLLVVLPVGAGVVLFVLVYGAANGMSTLTRALTLADLYGPRHYGAISSVTAAVASVCGAGAPFAAAALATLVGGGPVFLILAGLSLVSAVCNELVVRPRRSPATGDADSVLAT